MSERLGMELVTNGEFIGSLDGWTQDAATWTHFSDDSVFWLPDDTEGPDPDALRQTITIRTGKTYQLSFGVQTYSIFGSSLVDVSVGGTATAVTGAGDVTVQVVAGSNGLVELIGRNIELGDGVRFNYVSVKEVINVTDWAKETPPNASWSKRNANSATWAKQNPSTAIHTKKLTTNATWAKQEPSNTNWS